VAIFPALEPSTRTYDLGDFSMSRAAGFGGGEVRFMHAGADPIGHDASLGYELISGAELTLIRDHYRGQDGSHLSFQLPAIIWQGHPVGGILPTFGRWRYAGPPDETHRSGDLYDVTVSLRYVGTEPPSVA
jgi:hypothetical protein